MTRPDSTVQCPVALPDDAVFLPPRFYWVGLSHLGSGLAQPEARLSEDALALPHSQGNAIALAQVFGEHFAVPEMASVAKFPGVTSQIAHPRRPLFRVQCCRPAQTFAFAHPLKPAGFEPLDPASHCAPTFTKRLCDLLAALAACNQQQALQPMVVARLIGAHFLAGWRFASLQDRQLPVFSRPHLRNK
ncbi:MAG: hypothetical protein WCA45_16140 [Thiobacillaceae bacterium]